ncbi:MAG TPA: DMT family transporter [Acetobacteraceae bacterium]|nr:DMT family transporter [Acetobacteraceae bacterium]
MTAKPRIPSKLTETPAATLRGISLMMLGFAIVVASDTAARWAILRIGVAPVMIARGVIGSLTIFTATLFSGGVQQILPQNRKLVLLRGSLSGFVTFGFYVAWQHMSIADSFAISYTAPLIMTLLAIPLLGERLRWRRSLSTLIGFAGVLVILHPSGHLWQPASALLLAAVVVMALNRILMRMISRTDGALTVAFWVMFMQIPSGLFLLLILPWHIVLSWQMALVLGFMAVANALANALFARALALAPVSALAPFEYSTLIWGIIYGFAVFGDIPHVVTLAGAAVIAAAGLYNWHRERVRSLLEREVNDAVSD